ncbi:NmrA family transcriptional regulator [Sphingomonas sp. DBB INV C78]|uniref:SDR family oxidoreductase n=1 Tax=Sphingomonas sp. DBB INV C78 TaxID=3349434 RepID=UPI0036D439C7
MRIVVIGGTGLIGRQLVANLRLQGHEAVAASPKSGVNAVTGEGLADALRGADVVVDVANSPSFEDAAVLAFFDASTRNLIAAEKAAGVRHHVALSVVGTERLQGSGYFRAKLVQEDLIAGAGIPYSIVRATQFFEFMGAIAATSAKDDVVWLSPALMQPIASADVAAALADVVTATPLNGMVEIAGPEKRPLAEFVGTWMADNGDTRPVAVDPAAPYYGIELDDRSLTPDADVRVLPTRFDAWLARSLVKA